SRLAAGGGRPAPGLPARALLREGVPVHLRAVVLIQAEVERGEARDRRRDADSALRAEIRKGRACRRDARVHVVAVALAEAHGAQRKARLEAVEDELGRPTADVDDQGCRSELADAALCQLRLLAAREQPRREPVAPLDLAQERLAVLGFPDGARGDEQCSLGSERLGCAAVVGQGIAYARDRDGEKAASGVDIFAEPRDPRLAVQLLDVPVLDATDE